MKSKIPFVSLVLAGVALVVIGCGKSENSAPHAHAAAEPADGKTSIAITANDAMQFSVKEIQAKPGEALRLTLSNIGKMPKQSMAHNWVLLKPISDAEINSFGMAAASRAPEYLPEDRSLVLAHTKLLGGGESDTVEFNAPSAPGEYPFLCTFPGHFVMMKGKLIVN